LCGIVGYVGPGQALPFLMNGLAKLEYRGYDSAGVALIKDGRIQVRKTAGRLQKLVDIVDNEKFCAHTGIGHTRWATHGRPSDRNAHPHTDCEGDFALIHNGIIENFEGLRAALLGRRHKFLSETDTEVIPHLLEECYKGDFAEAVREAVAKLRGSYALAVVSRRHPDTIVAVRKDSPLIVGLGKGENYLASDIPAVLGHTRDIYVLEDGEMVIITPNSVQVTRLDGTPVDKKVFHVDWNPVQAERGGYAHFMLKEIHEQPKAIRDTLSGRISDDRSRVILKEIGLSPEEIKAYNRVTITACGTAFHAGMVTKYLIERLARVQVEVDVASEFRYRDPIIGPDTLLIVISQSGETADTLAGLREGKRRGARVIAITNVVGSSVAREADDVIYTWAGPEIAVASTKAYVTQLVAGSLLATYLAQCRGTIDQEQATRIITEIGRLPEKAQEVLALEDEVKDLARNIIQWEDAFFIGRGLDFALGLEGQLKLKEISYIHAEGYPAGEMKHGPIALIDEQMPIVALATHDHVFEKMQGNIQEAKARGGSIIAITTRGDTTLEQLLNKDSDSLFAVPATSPLLMPIVLSIPLQLLSYYIAVRRGCDVDQPRNLAKSVTVE